MNNEEVEIWKDIPNYEGQYQISNLGRAKSLKKYAGTNERILKYGKSNMGYVTIALSCNNFLKTFKVSVLVAMAFLNHKPDGTHKIVVDHIDNDKSNNRLENLQLITERENCSKDRKNKKTTSQYVGVYWSKYTNYWCARIYFNGRSIHLGNFKEEIDAHNAYQKAKKEANEGLDLNLLYPKKRIKGKYTGVTFDKIKNMWLAKFGKKYIGKYKERELAYQEREKYIKQLEILNN